MSTMSNPWSSQTFAASAITSRIGTEQLRRNRMFFRFEIEIAEGARRLAGSLEADHAVGTGEFGHDQSAAALVADQAAEHGVGDAGHRCKHGGGLIDTPPIRNSPASRRIASPRVDNTGIADCFRAVFGNCVHFLHFTVASNNTRNAFVGRDV